ncbi:MAG TPA: HNH endonuclease signature motif containing protein [Leptolyngbyaceae cyanobacterium]
MSRTYISSTLRQLVYDRANGCCEYCLIPEATSFAKHEIDHIIAEKHDGLTEAENLALSCTVCNKHKGSDLTSIDPETSQITPLYNPRRDRWSEHFQLSDGQFIPLTAIGRVTIRLLQLNHPNRVKERQLLIATNLLTLPD